MASMHFSFVSQDTTGRWFSISTRRPAAASTPALLSGVLLFLRQKMPAINSMSAQFRGTLRWLQRRESSTTCVQQGWQAIAISVTQPDWDSLSFAHHTVCIDSLLLLSAYLAKRDPLAAVVEAVLVGRLPRELSDGEQALLHHLTRPSEPVRHGEQLVDVVGQHLAGSRLSEDIAAVLAAEAHDDPTRTTRTTSRTRG